MSKLIPLLTGEFVRSDTVTAIRIMGTEYQENEVKNQVGVECGINSFSIIYFDTLDECKQYAEDLAKLINDDQ